MNLPMDPNKVCLFDPKENRCELEENLDILRGVSAFSGIPLQRLKVYAYLSKRMRYHEGEFLFRQGDMDDRGYIIISGRVRVIRELKDHSLLLHEFSEGDFIGGLALLSAVRRLFSARASTSLECLTLDRESFRKLMLQFPEVAIKVLDMMIVRIIQMEEKLLQSEACECICG